MRRYRVEHHGWCGHNGSDWTQALTGALRCAGLEASAPDKSGMLLAFYGRRPVWHKGVVFVGGMS